MQDKITDTTRIGDQEFEYYLVPIGIPGLKIWSFSFVRKLADGSLTTRPTGASQGNALRVVRWINRELTRLCTQMSDDIRIVGFVVADKTFSSIHHITLSRFAAGIGFYFYVDQNTKGEDVFFLVNKKISEDPARMCVSRDVNVRSCFDVGNISRKLDEKMQQDTSGRTGLKIKIPEE